MTGSSGRRMLGAMLLVGVVVAACGDDSAATVTTATTSAAVTTLPASTTVPRTTTTSEATTTTPAVERHGLLEAIEGGLVEAEFRSSGGASGDVVDLLIRRLGDFGDVTLALTVPAGFMLSNPAGGEQDLIVVGLEGRMIGSSSYEPVSEIELPNDDQRTYLLEAYCAEAHDANPSEGSFLTPGEMVDPDMAAVLDALDEAGATGSLYVIQAVIWALTDDVSTSYLESVGYGLDEEDLALAQDVIEAAGLDPADFRLFG